MLVETMTLDEVLHLLKEDLPQYNIKQKYIYDELARKTRKFKNRSRIWHIPREFKTKNGFNFISLYYSDPISVPKEERLRFISYCWFVLKNKFYIILQRTIVQTFLDVKIYNAHFINRYNERYLKKPSLGLLEVFRLFVQNNIDGANKGNATDEYPNGYICVTNDGLIYGERIFNQELNCETTIMKTFISWDMIGQDQQQLAMEGKLVLKEFGIDLSVPEDDFLPLFGNEKNGKYIETTRIKDSIEHNRQMRLNEDNMTKEKFKDFY